MKSFLTLVLLFILSLFALEAQRVASEKTAVNYLEQKNEVYFSFYMPEKEVFASLLNTISVDNIIDDKVLAYANAEEFQQFLDKKISYSVLEHPGDVKADLNMKTWEELQEIDLNEPWDFYPTYEAYVELMYWFEEEFPDMIKIVNIGQTVMGRDLLFAKIAPQVETQRPVPQFMYTSTMHGDETAGFILSLRLIYYLASNYVKDADITSLLDNVEIWICPNENPDGSYRNDNSTLSGATRGNINGVDLNRNYPNPVSQHSTRQTETLAMMNFADTINFIMSANMHGGIELVNYPFDSWKSSVRKHADHDWWEFVMYEYVDTVHKYSPAGYMTGQGDGVTHGGDWYVVYGSRQDYFNYYRSCREFTLELSNTKLLPADQLSAHWEYNYRSLLNYIRQATYGVHGFVYDMNTDEPLKAIMHILEHDKDNSKIETSLPYGNFNRPLLEGTYNITFSADGYETDTIKGVVVNNYETVYFNIDLRPLQQIAVSPDQINFGSVVIGNDYSDDLLIENKGTATLEIYALTIQGDDAFYLQEPVKSETIFIEPGENEIIELFFSPLDEQEYVAALFIESNDPENPELEVPVLGSGIVEAAVIAFSADTLYFGEVLVGETADELLTAYNHGNIRLYISGYDIDDSEHFDIQENFPVTIKPEKQRDFSIVFEPQIGGVHIVDAVFYSNDDSNPEAVVVLTGKGIDPSVVHEPDDQFFSITIFPNPVEHYSQITIIIECSNDFSLKMYNVNGGLIDVIFEGHLPVGEHTFNISSIYGQLQPGVYLLTVCDGNKQLSRRIVKW